jgi:hypothetical protein
LPLLIKCSWKLRTSAGVAISGERPERWELLAGVDVTALRAGHKIATNHIPDHASAQGRTGGRLRHGERAPCAEVADLDMLEAGLPTPLSPCSQLVTGQRSCSPAFPRSALSHSDFVLCCFTKCCCTGLTGKFSPSTHSLITALSIQEVLGMLANLRGIYRIRHASKGPVLYGSDENAPDKKIEADTEVARRIIRLLPADGVGAYLSGKQLASNSGILEWWALVGLALCIFLRYIGTQPKAVAGATAAADRTPQVIAIGCVALSYIAWVHAMGDKLPLLGWLTPGTATLCMIVLGVVVPYFYKGDDVAKG